MLHYTTVIYDKFKSGTDQKTTRMGQKTWKKDFVTRQCNLSQKSSEKHFEIVWM